MAGRKGMAQWRNALIQEAMRKDHTDPERRIKLHIIAERVCTLAMEGDMQAVKEIGDRFDGKVPQAITGEDGGPVELDVKVSDAAQQFLSAMGSLAARSTESDGEPS